MKLKKLRLPIIILVIGILASVISCLLTGIAKEPTVKEHDFSFSVTYKLDGEEKTFYNVYSCKYHDYDEDVITTDRFYVGEYKEYGLTSNTGSYAIAQKDEYFLCVVTTFNDAYLMNDTKNKYYEEVLEEPYLVIYDKEGYCYEEAEKLSMFDAEIISWEYPEPIENSFEFVGFSVLNEISMFCMLLIGLLMLILCIILVKKDKDVIYGTIDILGIVLNFLAGFIALPLITIASWFIQAFQMGPDWIYQIYLCLPAITAFSLAASISLRRKGLKVTGFSIQFLSPVIIFILALIENII